MEVHQNSYSSIEGYELGEIIGSGGSAHVYKARQLSTGQTVALKLLHSHDKANRARFERECNLCAQLQHPYIVRIHDSGKSSNGTPFTVFEYVPGETLADWLLKNGTMPVQMATELMLQVLDALACMHRHAMVHRDLNPRNIMLMNTGAKSSIKLLDFGISALLPAAQDADYTQITLTTNTLGTPAYSAPEQLRGDTPTEPADIYAWALIFVECLTGHPALNSGSVAEVIQQQLSLLDIPLPPSLATHPLGTVLRQALKKNPRRRSADAARLWHEIHALQVQPLINIHATPSSPAIDGFADVVITQVIPESYKTRHELTALCLRLSLQGQASNPETLNAIQEELLNRGADIASQHQGDVQGCLSNCLLLTFGYPKTDSDSVRRAIVAAQAMLTMLTEHDSLLMSGLTLQVHIGLDSGVTLTAHDGKPNGAPVNNALRLAQLARADAILLSDNLLATLGNKTCRYHMGPLTTIGDAPAMQARYLEADVCSTTENTSASLAFCGRQTELEQLHQLWEERPGTPPSFALITGEAGVGKSRLLREFERSLNHFRPRTLHFHCYPEQRHQALYPVLRLLQQQLKLSSKDPSPAQSQRLQQWCTSTSVESEALRAIVCQWLALPAPEHLPLLQYSPQKQKKLLINALIKWLQQSQVKHCNLLVIEDIHWSDPTTMTLLNQLAEEAVPSRLMVLATSRSTDRLILPSQARVVALQPLTPIQARGLIAQQLPERVSTPSLIDEITERSGGLPFFIEELIGLLKSSPSQPVRSSIPRSLRQSLSEHLSNIGPALDTAQVAACIGREFSAERLSQILNIPGSDIEAQLNHLIATDIIQHDSSTQGCYQFRHVMLQDAASQSMTQAAFTEAHLLIADALAADPVYAHQHQLLARHFACAENYIEAVQHGTEAAQQALGQALNEDASALAHSAMDWATKLSGTARTRAELKLNEVLTHIRILSAGWADAKVKAHADHSLTLISQLDQDHSVYSSLWSLALYHHVAGDREITAQLADQLIELTASDPDSTLHCHATGLRGQCAFIDGQFQQAQHFFQQSLSLYETRPQQAQLSLSSVDTKVWSLSQLANMQWLSGWQHQAAATSAEALSWAQRLGHVPSFGIALLYRAMLCQFAGDKDATAQISQVLQTLSTQYDLPAYQGYATVLNAWACNDLRQLQEMLAGLRFMGCQLGLSQYDSLTADIFLHSDQPQHAAHALEQCLEFSRQTGENYYRVELHLRLAKILSNMGPEHAERCLFHQEHAAHFSTQQRLQPHLEPPVYVATPRLTLPERQLILTSST